ncbi:hypothetical protein MMB17_18495 [Methylobacterium organophilum]|uniref:hypothetical protein n=1 Tax=Methylobacterium organophilum TaxID=410 RepID=UPI001F1362E4|nr:hypothetical protein [Methylobacterium organophilum]UMY16652.1 hypothetical protein MMB17_18495 [Methylobacterium organophilum]
MAADLAALRRDRAKASARMSELVAAARGRSMTDDETRDFESAASEVTRLDGEISAGEGTQTVNAATTVTRADAAEIARICVTGGQPAMVATLLAEGASVEDAKKRVAAAGEAKNLVALARAKDPSIPEDLAARMLAEGKGVEDIRTALFDKLVAAENKTSISSHVPAGDNPSTDSAKQVDLAADMKRRHGIKD